MQFTLKQTQSNSV